MSVTLGGASPSVQEDPRGWDLGDDPYASREAARRLRYREYLAFYRGEQWEGRPLPGERRLTVNYARVLVRKAISYLFAGPVTQGVIDAAGSRQVAEAERLLLEVADFNELARQDFAAAVDAAVVGDGAYKVTWDATAGLPRVTAVDPADLSVWWWLGDARHVTRVVQRLTMSSDEARERYGWRRRGMPRTEAAARFVVALEEWTGERFRVTVAGDVVHDGPNPFGAIPYVIWPNEARAHQFWGESDLADLVEVGRELNQRMSTVSQVLHLSGAPIAVIEGVEATENLIVRPGAKWELPADAKAYLLDLLGSQGVMLHEEHINALYRALHDLAETPRTSFGDSGRDLSGAAMEVELQPMVQKVKRKRAVWDGVYQRRNALILGHLERLGGRRLGGVRRTRANWPAILPSDRTTEIADQVSMVGAGLTSHRRAMVALGEEDPEGALAEIAEERKAESALAADGDAGAPVERVEDGDEGE